MTKPTKVVQNARAPSHELDRKSIVDAGNLDYHDRVHVAGLFLLLLIGLTGLNAENGPESCQGYEVPAVLMRGASGRGVIGNFCPGSLFGASGGARVEREIRRVLVLGPPGPPAPE